MKERLFKKEYLGKIILAGGLLFGGAAFADYKVQNNLLEGALQDKFPSVEYACWAGANRSGESCGLEIVRNTKNPLTREQREQILKEATSYRQSLIDNQWGKLRYMIDTLGSLVLVTSPFSIPIFFADRARILKEDYEN